MFENLRAIFTDDDIQFIKILAAISVTMCSFIYFV